MKKIISTLFFLLLLFSLHGQTDYHCSFDSVFAYRKRINPNAEAELKQFMLNSVQLSQKLPPDKIYPSAKRGLAPNMANYVIPIVVHIIHKTSDTSPGTGSNISDAQVNNQIIALNKYFKPYGIQFCLATKDAAGNPMTGITRRGHSLTNYRENLDEADLMSLDLFQRDKYLNIWVVNSILDDNGVDQGQTGSGSFPDSRKRGVVIRARFFGDSMTCVSCNLHTQARGKTLVHEIGHLLGLLHTHEGGCQGTDTSNCSKAGDYICDTPPMEFLDFNCVDTNTCIETPVGYDFIDPIHNYMSYKRETCLDTFTPQQVRVMYYNIETYFETNIDIDNIKATTDDWCGYVTALFKAENNLLCNPNLIRLTALDSNSAHDYDWTIYNQATKTTTKVSTGSDNYLLHNFSAYGTYDITLTVTDNSNNKVIRTQKSLIKIINCGGRLSSTRGNWYFGEYAGLEFRQNATIPNIKSWEGAFSQPKSNLNSLEGCLVQNNKNGGLLFYAGGKAKYDSGGNPDKDSFYVYDKDHRLMPNGILLGTSTSSYGGLSIPVPGSGKRFYLFTTNHDNLNRLYAEDCYGLRYSIIDTSLNSGKGDVETANKNKPIKLPFNRPKSVLDSALIAGEGIAAIPGCDSAFYYLIVTSMHKDSLLGRSIEIFKVNSTGITHHFQYWHSANFSAIGSIVASPDGRLVSVCGLLFEFDRDAGTLAFLKDLQDKDSSGVPLGDFYHARFSPNSKILYILRHILISPGEFSKELRQYDLSTDLNKPSTTTLKVNAFSLQNAPDGRMYISQYADNYMSYLAKPNSSNTFTANNFDLQTDKVYLKMGTANMKSMGGLPNFIDAVPQKDLVKSVFHRITSCNQVYFYTNHTCGSSYLWNFGDSGSGSGKSVSHSYSGKTDTFYVTLTVDGTTTYYDTIRFGFSGTAIGGPNTTCDTSNKSVFYLSPPQPGLYEYYWSASNGAVTSNPSLIYADVKWSQDNGYVRVIATDKYGCKDTATRNFQFSNLIQNNSISVTNDCQLSPITGSTPTGGSGNYKYIWRVKPEGGKWSTLADTTRSLTPLPTSQIMEYQRWVKSGGCISYSNVVSAASLDNANRLALVALDSSYCYMRIKGSHVKKFYPGATVTWQISTDLATWSTYSAPSDTLTNSVSRTSPKSYYRRKVVFAACTSYSNVIEESPIILQQPNEIEYCDSLEFPLVFTYKIAKNFIAQWQYKHDSLGPEYWVPHSRDIGSQDTLFEMYQNDTDNIQGGDSIRLLVRSIGCPYGLNSVYSKIIVPKKIDTLVILRQPKDTTVNAGNSARFSLGVNLHSRCSYVWQFSADGNTGWTDMAGTDDSLYHIQFTGACQNNFYYRARVIHPCTTKYSNKAKLTLTNLNNPTFDYWMKDQWKDTGREKNMDTIDLVRSPDLWLRNKKDSVKIHQFAISNIDTNWIFVTIRNKGINPTNKAKLYLYWTWASTGEQWRKSWTYNASNRINNRPMGGEINKIGIPIDTIAKGDSLTIAVPWTQMPQLNWYDLTKTFWNDRINICYLARIETCDIDPFGMTFREKMDVKYNVAYNNNIVTRNSYIIEMQAPNDDHDDHSGSGGQTEQVFKSRPDINSGGVIRVENVNDQADEIKFCVSLKEPAYLTKANAYLEIGEDLHSAWIASGSYSSGLVHVEHNIYQMSGADACIYNIAVDSGFADGIRMYFAYKDANVRFPDASVYNFSVRQYDQEDEYIGECWFQVRDNPFVPTDTTETDSVMTACDWSGSGGLIGYTVEKPSWPHTIYDVIAEDYISINGSGMYSLPEGEYVITCSSTYHVYKTNLMVYSVNPTPVNSIDTVWYNCDNPDEVTYFSPCENGIMYDMLNQVVDESEPGQYLLNPQETTYTFICDDSSNCFRYIRTIVFKDILVVPGFTSNYLTGMYNRQEHPCCFIDLTEAECDGETPLTFGQEIQVYDMNADFLYQTNLELYGSTVLGFRFCPPQWDTSSNVISNWYSIVIRNDECSFCRMDFMCDSLADPEPFIILNYPSWKLNVNQGNEFRNVKSSAEVDTFGKPGKLPTSVSIYPNPTTSEVNLKVISVYSTHLSVYINDAAGQLVYTGSFETSNNSLSAKIDLSGLASGVYTVFIPELNYYYKLVIIR